jgi:hypothetical protein
MRKGAFTIACPRNHAHTDALNTHRSFLGRAIHLGMATAAASMLWEQSWSSDGRGGSTGHSMPGRSPRRISRHYWAKRLRQEHLIDDVGWSGETNVWDHHLQWPTHHRARR